MGYRDYSTGKGLIVDASGHGDFSTIQAAITAASAGHTVFVRDGVYTENITHKPGVSLTAFSNSGLTPTVTIIGKITLSAAGNYSISNVGLQTNSDFALSVEGSAALSLQCNDVFLNCTNNTGISFTNSNAGSVLAFRIFTSNITTTGIALYNMSCPGDILFLNSDLQNTGLSSTASNNSAGAIIYTLSILSMPITTSGTGALALSLSRCDTGQENTSCLITSGTSTATIANSELLSGSASAISIGTGTAVTIAQCTVASSNTNAITGLGTLNAGIITFTGTSSTINTSTVNKLTTYGGTVV
jgi:hypothetical protein